MARYIDLDKLLEGLEDELKDKNPNDIAYLIFKLFIDRLNHEPTADVVPKSEVDDWIITAKENLIRIEELEAELSKANADVKNYLKVAEYQQSLSMKRYREVERLKEDIERLEDINERDVENLRLAKAEIVREIFEELESIFDKKKYVPYPLDVLAELKKKYTEEKT